MVTSTVQSNATCWQTNVARYAVWDGRQANVSGIRPDVGFVDPMLRRRLSPLARAALHVAQICTHDIPSVSFIYASRHGELDRTVELLQSVVTGEAPSPTTFGLSVLNAATGIYSIARKDFSPTTAITAGRETFAFGLLEAHARAKLNPDTSVLYVYADAPVPAPFGRQAGDPDDILAIAMLITPEANHRLSSSYCPVAPDCPENEDTQAAACLRCIENSSSATWSSSQRTWHWNWQ